MLMVSVNGRGDDFLDMVTSTVTIHGTVKELEQKTF